MTPDPQPFTAAVKVDSQHFYLVGTGDQKVKDVTIELSSPVNTSPSVSLELFNLPGDSGKLFEPGAEYTLTLVKTS